MINLLEQLNDKDKKPLAKKSEELGIPQPTNVPLAQGVASTDKSAQMAASPQAKTSAQQKSLRSEQVASQAPREVTGAQSSLDMAQTLINNLAAVNQEAVEKEQTEAVAALDPTGGARYTDKDITDLIKEDKIVFDEAGVPTHKKVYPLDEDGNEDLTKVPTLVPIEKDMSGLADTEALEVTAGELFDFTDTTEGSDNKYVSDILKKYYGPNIDPNNISLEQLKDAVSQEIDDITVLVDDARETISDPNQPANVRQEARQLMKDYGAAHLIATDAELDAFENDIKNVGLIEIKGETYTLEQLGDNPAIAASLLSAAEQIMDNPELTAEDLSLPPALFEFAKTHANAIDSVFDDNRNNLVKFKETVDANVEFKKSLGPELSEALGLNEFTAENLSEGNPGLKALSDMSTLMANSGLSDDEIKGTLAYIATKSPEKLEEWMKSGSTSELKHLSDIYAISQTSGFTSLGRATGVDFTQIQKLLKDVLINPDKYDDKVKEQLRLFDSNNDGSIDSLEKIKEIMADSALNGTSFTSLNGMRTVGQKQETFIRRLIPDIPNPHTLIGKERNSVKSQVSKALKTLDKIKNKDHPLVKEAYETLKGMWKQLQGIQVKDWVTDKDTAAKNETRYELRKEIRSIPDPAHNPEAYDKHITYLESLISQATDLELSSKEIADLRQKLGNARSIRNSMRGRTVSSDSTGTSRSEGESPKAIGSYSGPKASSDSSRGGAGEK